MTQYAIKFKGHGEWYIAKRALGSDYDIEGLEAEETCWSRVSDAAFLGWDSEIERKIELK